MPASWRLLLDDEAAGPWNMGVDEALLERAATTGLATLRVYHWDGAWLSLGHAQQLASDRRQACEAAGVGLVRRATGGRAVLHGCDLTYAVAAPIALLTGPGGRAGFGGLRQSYGLLSRALLGALKRLGVAAERTSSGLAAASDRGGFPPAAFDCFEQPAADEICVAGRKLAGSAQRRWPGALLQHGSLRLEPDPDGVLQAVGFSSDSATSLAQQGCRPSRQELRRACAESFAETLGVALVADALSDQEREQARQRCALHAGNSLAVPGLPHRNGSRVYLSGR